MLKIGAFTFGGGYAMIALLENEFITKRNWIEKDEFLDMVAIAESTPGPIAINSATYIGYKLAGILGSVFATLGMVLPSLVIIYVISMFFDQFLKITYVAYAFKGIQVCVIYLILSAGIKLLKSLKKNVFNTIITVSVIVTMLACSVFAITFSAILYVLITGIIGVLINLISSAKKKGGTDQ